MKSIIILLSSLLICSCATNRETNNSLPPTPPSIESPIKKIDSVKENVGKLDNLNTQITKNIDVQKNAVTTQKTIIEDALKNAETINDKIKSNQTPTEVETFVLVDQLTKIKERNLFLETNNDDLVRDVVSFETTLKEIKKDLIEANSLIIAKDGEVSQLRNNYNYAIKVIDDKNDETSNLRVSLEKKTKEAERSSVYRRWVIGIVVSVVLWTIIKNVLMVYFPLTKFRI